MIRHPFFSLPQTLAKQSNCWRDLFNGAKDRKASAALAELWADIIQRTKSIYTWLVLQWKAFISITLTSNAPFLVLLLFPGFPRSTPLYKSIARALAAIGELEFSRKFFFCRKLTFQVNVDNFNLEFVSE